MFYTVKNHLAFNQVGFEFDGCLCYQSITRINTLGFCLIGVLVASILLATSIFLFLYFKMKK